MSSLYVKARNANATARDAAEPGMIRATHCGIKWEVFYEDYSEYDPQPFVYLGSLESPDMFNHDLSREYDELFKAWFLERIRAYGALHGFDEYSFDCLCYRTKEPFGAAPRREQMTFPFKGATEGG